MFHNFMSATEELRSLQYLGYHENILSYYQKTFLKHLLYFEQQNHAMLFKVLFYTKLRGED